MQPQRITESTGLLAHWSRVSLRAQGVSVLVFPVAVLFAALFTIYWADGDLRNTEAVVALGYETRSEITQFRSSLLDAETAESAYRVTHEERFRAAGDAAQTSARAALAHMQALMSDVPSAPNLLEQLSRMTQEELSILAQMRAAAAGTDLVEREKALMPQLLDRVSSLTSLQNHVFAEARNQRDASRQRLYRTVVLFGVLGPLGGLFIHLLVSGRMVRRLQRVEENARRLAHGLPLEPLPAGTDEIASLARQLEDAAYLLHGRDTELRGSERCYRDLFNKAPIPYEETDCEGVVTRFNQAVCSLLRCSPDQILGRHAWDFVAPNEQDSFRARMLDRIASGQETGPFECDYMLEDGTRIAVEIRENLMHNDQGQVIGVCRSLLDVTERNLATMAARKVEQYAMELRNKNEQLGRALDAAHSATAAKSRFLASISHELRTPLNGIIGFSEMLYDGRLGSLSEEQRDVVSDILTSGRHLLQLINDILDLSKVEAGRMEFRPEPCVLNQLVSEVRDIVRPLAEKKNIQISTDVPRELSGVIDPSRFKQVLYNYLSNAVKFTGRDGSVSIRISREGEQNFRLEVEDTGTGIPANEISRLFQEFEQLPNSRKAEQGTGLGLALTRHIVEAQGGTVAVRSEVGRGSIFSAVLPLNSTRLNGNIAGTAL